MDRALVLLILIACCTVSDAQDYTFLQFGQKEGLAHSQVLDIAQDTNGNLWLGTATSAIYRFDGKKFFQYKIAVAGYTGSIFTYKVLADQRNSIWIVTNLGIVRFNGKVSQLLPSRGKLISGFASKLLADQKGTPWMIDSEGNAFEVKDDSLKMRPDIRELLEQKVAGYYLDEKNGLCFFSRQNKVVSVGITGELQRHDLPWAVTGAVTEVHRNQYSDIIATPGRMEEFTEGKQEEILLPGAMADVHVRQLAKDRNGLIWGLTGYKLLVVGKDRKTEVLSGNPTFSGNYVNCLFRDNVGDVWISVDGKGILKYKKQAWKKLPSTVEKDITAIVELPQSHRLLFGTYDHGLLGWGSAPRIKTVINSLTVLDETRILAGTLGSGLLTISEASAVRIQLPSPAADYVHGVSKVGSKIVVGTPTGLCTIDGAVTKHYSRKIRGRLVPMTVSMTVNDTTFFAGMGAGLMKLKGDSIIATGPDFLRESTIYNISKQSWGGYVVTGEFSKMLFFDKKFKFLRAIELGSFASNVLVTEFLDSATAIVGSNDGLFKVMFSRNVVRSVKRYGKADGYGEEEIYGGSALTRSNGEIVIGTVNGAYSFNPLNEEVNSTPPTVYMTGVEWIHQDRDSGSLSQDGYFGLPRNLRLAHDQNSITFSYDYSNLNDPNDITFHHELEGIESTWSALNTTQQVNYSNLSPGNYTFSVQAVSGDNLYGNLLKYQFTIVPAFWQTPSFYGLVGLFFTGGIFLIARLVSYYRIKQHQIKEEIRAAESIRIRKQMSMDFHDEMGNKLAGMLGQASLLKTKYKTGELVKVFDYFERSSYALYHGTKDFIWSIDVNSNNLKEVISYLRDFGFQFFERNNITFHVEDDILDAAFDRNLPHGYNRQIILIFKEAMTNALKHAACKNVFFSARAKNGSFKVEFADDGTWQREALNGIGIRNMFERATRIHSAIRIDRENERTVISLAIKLS